MFRKVFKALLVWLLIRSRNANKITCFDFAALTTRKIIFFCFHLAKQQNFECVLYGAVQPDSDHWTSNFNCLPFMLTNLHFIAIHKCIFGGNDLICFVCFFRIF